MESDGNDNYNYVHDRQNRISSSWSDSNGNNKPNPLWIREANIWRVQHHRWTWIQSLRWPRLRTNKAWLEEAERRGVLRSLHDGSRPNRTKPNVQRSAKTRVQQHAIRRSSKGKTSKCGSSFSQLVEN